MHKIVTGYSPSDTTISGTVGALGARKIQRSPILWRSLLAFIHTVPDAMLDLMGVGAALVNLDAQSPLTAAAAIPKQFAKYDFCSSVNISQIGILSAVLA